MERALQLRYLRAMGIDVWVPRGPAEAGGRSSAREGAPPCGDRTGGAESGSSHFVIGPGSDSLLLLCGRPEDAAMPVAADIARCLEGEPVWGWPAPDGGAEGVSLEEAVREGRFTGVMVFGDFVPVDTLPAGSAGQGGARMLRVPAVSDLARDPAARRALWNRLRETDWCARPGRSAAPA